MDCEKFDEHVMDALYGELDELTAAALRRHVESCSRCAPIYANLKSAREGAVLPLEEPPDDFEERVLAAERAVQHSAPWYKKVVRAAAWAGSHAMRPQLAMAALFMFVIGSSLLLLRAKPGTFAPVSVSEKGAPAADEEGARAAAPAATAAPQAAAKYRAPAAAAEQDKAETGAAATAQAEPKSLSGEEGQPKEDSPGAMAPAAPEASAAAKGAGIPSLEDALATKERDGCSAAEAKLQQIADSDGKDAPEAKRQLSDCRKAGSKAGATAAPPNP